MRSILVACLVSCAAATMPPQPVTMPGPYRNRGEAAAMLNTTCVGCHEREAAAWTGSLHHRAFANPAFQAAFAVEPGTFCSGCHAPEQVSALGVGCVTCHVTEDGSVLAAASSTRAPHRVRVSADFARTGGCAGCHEFRFPGAPGLDDGFFMQTTLREHRRSPAAGQACASCHAPHAIAEVRDPAWLRAHLRVRAELVGESARITLEQTTPAHAFPTGDLFRRLEVGCEVRAQDGTVLAREVRHLERRFEIVPGRAGRTLTADDRVLAEPAVVELPLGSARGSSVAWWVTYQRVAFVGIGANTAAATIESEVRLDEGVLPCEIKP